MSNAMQVGLRTRCRHAGLSMVELLVALGVGVFLTAGVVQLLVSSRVSYNSEENFSRLQENGRFAINMLAREARMARNMGCRSLMLEEFQETLNVLACDLLDAAGCTGDPIIGTEVPFGYDNSQASAPSEWLASLPASATEGSSGVDDRWVRGDVIVLWGASGGAVFVDKDTDSSRRTNPIEIEASSSELNENDLVLVTDCEGSDLFRVTGTRYGDRSLAHARTYANGAKANYVEGGDTVASLSRSYNAAGDTSAYQVPGTRVKAMAFPFDYRIYFICSSAATGRDSLCRWRPRPSANSRLRDIVSDVRDLRVTYTSIDLNGDATITDGANGEFVDATADELTASDWASVASAQVELLAASAEEVRSDAGSPADTTWPGGTGDRLGASLADDRRLYERFATTIALRTRAPWYIDNESGTP